MHLKKDAALTKDLRHSQGEIRMSTERETFPIEQKEEGTQTHYDFADVMRVL